jgi:ketosteroid isomerase-like protein
MKTLCLILISLATVSCVKNKSSKDDDLAQLLKMHAADRSAHFNKDASALFSNSSDSLISVNRGKIHINSGKPAVQGFQDYFNSVEFKKWDDVNHPKIRFSDDHTLAYAVVDKLVVLETKESTGRQVEETTHYAWVSIYRKHADGTWKLECITSTNEPAQVRSI